MRGLALAVLCAGAVIAHSMRPAKERDYTFCGALLLAALACIAFGI